MTLEQLQQFLVLAKLKSFSRTAEALYVSHSTISRNMSMLEQSLGVSLLVRDTRSVSLTYAGQILYQKGMELNRHLESIIHEVQMAGLGARGSLKVASINYYDETLFKAFRSITMDNPDVNLIMTENDLAHIVQDILYDNMDIGITFSYALGGEKDQFDVIPISQEHFCVFAADSIPMDKLQHYAETGEIDAPTLIINDLSYEFVEHLMDGYRLENNRPAIEHRQATSLESMLLQIHAGVGVALVPEHVARRYSEGCRVLPLDVESSAYEIVMFFKKNNTNPVLPIFVDQFRQLSAQANA